MKEAVVPWVGQSASLRLLDRLSSGEACGERLRRRHVIAAVRRGPVLMVSGLALSAVYAVGLHAATRYAVDATIQHDMEMHLRHGANLTVDAAGLAEDLAGIREEVRRRTFPVGAVTVCLSFIALLLPWSRRWTRYGVLVLSGVLWAIYPLTVLSTLGMWGSFMVGDGGATGVSHEFAGWLPLAALVLFTAAMAQAIGLVLLARRGMTAASRVPTA
ncbi:hypothetical protein [Streptosporangium album]|uniref:hypothetical protein n=1 Tax=Streptosporangium album TaxID=47479 RepID=UPI001615E9C9|nr:hypothetical protein [Streptosporangium album]